MAKTMQEREQSRQQGKKIADKGLENIERGKKFLKTASVVPIAAPVIAAIGAGHMIAGVIQQVKGGFQSLFNHPQWYQIPGVKDDYYPTGVNYARDRALPLGSEKESMSQPLYYTIYDKMVTYAKGDHNVSLFRSAVQDITTTLASNSGRLPSYSAQQVAEYIHNVTSTIAMLSATTRSWLSMFQSDITDSSMPSKFTDVMGCSQWVDSPDVRDVLRRAWTRLSVFPMPCDLGQKRMWMYSNIFADYNGEKPTYMLHMPIDIRMYVDGEEITRNGSSFSHGTFFNIGTPDVPFSDHMQAIFDALDLLESEYSGAQIRADLLRVYGNNVMTAMVAQPLKFLETPRPPFHYVFDGYMQRKLSNLTFACPSIGPVLSAPGTATTGDPYSGFQVVCWDNEPSYAVAENNYNTNVNVILGKYADQIFIDGSDVALDAKAEQLSISDLALALNATTHAFSSGNVGPAYLVSSCGTEIPIVAQCYYNIVGTNGVTFSSQYVTSIRTITLDDVNSLVEVLNLLKGSALSSGIDTRPRMRTILLENSYSNTSTTPWGVVDDWPYGRVAELSRDNLRARHAVATYTLTVPKSIELQSSQQNTFRDHGRSERKK